MIISKNKKKSLLDILTKKKSPNEKEVAELNEYLTSIIFKIGYKEDIEIIDSDNDNVYGRIKDNNMHFHIPINPSSSFEITTIEGDDTNSNSNNYYICVGNKTINNNRVRFMFPRKTSSQNKRGNQITYKYNINEYQVYDSLVLRGKKSVSCHIKGPISNEELLDKYFCNLDINKSVLQIFNEISSTADYRVDKLQHFSILIQYNRETQECISFNDGKLVSLYYNKNDEGYFINNGKIDIYTNEDNELDICNIDFDEDNAIITIGNNKYPIPLNILDYLEKIEYSETEEVNRVIRKFLGKKLIERKGAYYEN